MIKIAQSDEEITRCFPIMAQLRPNVLESAFVGRVRRQMNAGYRLAFLESAGAAAAVAGFRLGENLLLGKFMYVDDLVTDESHRSKGFGKKMMEWLAGYAKENGCTHVELDSGVQRFPAHRFYLREGMDIRGHHFSLKL